MKQCREGHRQTCRTHTGFKKTAAASRVRLTDVAEERYALAIRRLFPLTNFPLLAADYDLGLPVSGLTLIASDIVARQMRDISILPRTTTLNRLDTSVVRKRFCAL